MVREAAAMKTSWEITDQEVERLETKICRTGSKLKWKLRELASEISELRGWVRQLSNEVAEIRG